MIKDRLLNNFVGLLIGTIIFFNWDYSFAQSLKEIKIVSPSGNYELNTGKREGISWISRNTRQIDLEYSLDQKKWIRIFSNINSDIEILGWKVPSKINGKKIKIRIVDHRSKEILDETINWIIISNIKNST